MSCIYMCVCVYIYIYIYIYIYYVIMSLIERKHFISHIRAKFMINLSVCHCEDYCADLLVMVTK